jgi:hypothetical protein
MINCAIRIHDQAWQDWLEPVAATRRLCAVECSAGLFSEADFPAQLNKYGIRCLHARDLLPGDTAAFLSESASEEELIALRRNLFGIMISAAATDTQVFSLQLRLDRISAEKPAQQLERHAQLLQPLLAAPLDKPYQLAIQVRQPRPYPQSREWDHALDICQRAKSPRIGLAVHLHPDDFDNLESFKPVLDSCFEHLRVLCFHYNPLLSETLFDDEQLSCSEELKARNYQGLVVFCPVTDERSNLQGVCEDALSWADFYS